MLDRSSIEQARLLRIARDQLVENEPSVNYSGLAEGRASTELAARQWVKRQRSADRLFVIDHGTGALIPSFQLDEVFDLNPLVTSAIRRLLTFGMNGWAIWSWFTATNPWIEARPIDVIGTPDLEAALSGLLDA